MSVQIKVEVRGFKKVQNVLKQLSTFDLRDLLDVVGSEIENQVRRRISRQEGPPEGGAWHTWDPDYKRWKEPRSSGGFLELYGHLVESLQYVVSTSSVEIGSNLVYAGPNQATRPFLGLSDENQDDVEAAVEEWLWGEMGI